MGEQVELHKSFTLNRYMFRRKVLKIFGGAFHVYDENDNVVFYSEQKAFKLREDFRIYADEGKTSELLTIKTPQILDIGATYFVTDATTGQSVGALRRKALKSILKDEWALYAAGSGEEEVGVATETSLIGALLSRFINIIPQTYVVKTSGGEIAATIRQHFNPFILKYTMEISSASSAIDRRLLIATGIMLAGIEGRQSN